MAYFKKNMFKGALCWYKFDSYMTPMQGLQITDINSTKHKTFSLMINNLDIIVTESFVLMS